MKKILLIFALLCALIYPHPGRTDEDGGHYNRSTGEYHYHHGYPEHQHPNSMCPYEISDGSVYEPASSKPNSAVITKDKDDIVSKDTNADTVDAAIINKDANTTKKKSIKKDIHQGGVKVVIIFLVLFGPSLIIELFKKLRNKK